MRIAFASVCRMNDISDPEMLTGWIGVGMPQAATKKSSAATIVVFIGLAQLFARSKFVIF